MGVIFVLTGGLSMSSSSKLANVRCEHTCTFLVHFPVLGRVVLDPFDVFFKSKDTFCDSLF